jgi:hypothetical protein
MGLKVTSIMSESEQASSVAGNCHREVFKMRTMESVLYISHKTREVVVYLTLILGNLFC